MAARVLNMPGVVPGSSPVPQGVSPGGANTGEALPNKRADCPHCMGKGTVEDAGRLGDTVETIECERCDGRGWLALCIRCESTYLGDEDPWSEPCDFCYAKEYADLKWSDEDGDAILSQRKDDAVYNPDPMR